MTEYIKREDAISRKWILKELNAESEKDYPSFRRVMEKIEDATPVEPKRPKGEWMPIIEANELGDTYKAGIYCSECGETLSYEANFCPNCGADMRKGVRR